MGYDLSTLRGTRFCLSAHAMVAPEALAGADAHDRARLQRAFE